MMGSEPGSSTRSYLWGWGTCEIWCGPCGRQRGRERVRKSSDSARRGAQPCALRRPSQPPAARHSRFGKERRRLRGPGVALARHGALAGSRPRVGAWTRVHRSRGLPRLRLCCPDAFRRLRRAGDAAGRRGLGERADQGAERLVGLLNCFSGILDAFCDWRHRGRGSP